MFDISSDILIPTFDMIDNNNLNNKYYGDYYESGFDEFEQNQVLPANSPSVTYANQYQSPQHTYASYQTPIQQPSSATSSSFSQQQLQFNPSNQYPNSFGSNYNQYGQNLNSINVNLNDGKYSNQQQYNQVNQMNFSQDGFSTPSATPQIQSPNFMYPQSYDMASGNSYYDYKVHNETMQQSNSIPSLQNTPMMTTQPYNNNTNANTSYDPNYVPMSSPQLQVQTNHIQAPGPSSMSSSVSNDSTIKKSSAHSPKERKQENKIITSNTNKFRVVRGIAAGGSTAKPLKDALDSDSVFLPIELNIIGGRTEDICTPGWSYSEKEDRRRIVRIERIQNANKIIANFTILGSANENPTVLPPPANSNIDVIEVSCLECSKEFSQDEEDNSESYSPLGNSDGEYDYFITSVEVIEIVELLIGTMPTSSTDRRKERGRVRSNLVPFWSKKPISSRIENNPQPDYRVELAKRIMSYEIRKPRGFDKEVRILKWDKLIPALKRALQCYYCELPPNYN